MLIIFVSDVFDLILVTGKTVFTEQKLPQTNHLYKECEYKKKSWIQSMAYGKERPTRQCVSFYDHV